VWLPDEADKRQTELQAWQTLGEEEKRAAGVAVYMCGQLKTKGIDPLPHIRSFNDLAGLANARLHSYDSFKQGFSFNAEQIERMSEGQLPWPFLLEQIDQKLSTI